MNKHGHVGKILDGTMKSLPHSLHFSPLHSHGGEGGRQGGSEGWRDGGGGGGGERERDRQTDRQTELWNAKKGNPSYKTVLSTHTPDL